MVPMRSIIKYVLDDKNRDKYKYVKILYGSRMPCQVLFMDEIDNLGTSVVITFCNFNMSSQSEELG